MADPMGRVLAALRAAGCPPRVSGRGYSARCPSHEDRAPSLSISVGDAGQVLVHCHAGCDTGKDVLPALGLTMRELASESGPSRRPRQRGLSRAGSRKGRERHARPEHRSPTRDWPRIAADFAEQLDDDRANRLAAQLGAPPDRLEVWRAAIRGAGVGWCTGEQLGRTGYGAEGPAWTVPFITAAGEVVGLSVRFEDPEAKKKARGEASRGLIRHKAFGTFPGPVLIVEGASDVIAAATEGIPALGRLSAASVNACPEIAKLCAGRPVFVVAERDEKPDARRGTRWPGLEGARKVERELRALGLASVGIKLPPPGVKDLREWILGHARSVVANDE